MIMLEDANWRKSSRSDGQGGACVEVAITAEVVGVRDSKDRGGAVLVFSREQWAAFASGVQAGEFDI